MARIAGVDIPREKRLEISLTYIFGIGRTRALAICEKADVDVATKTDHLSEAEIIKASWAESSGEAHWRNRDPEQPFFSVFNLMASHQSRTMVWPREKFVAEVQSKLTDEEKHDPRQAPLPPYYPDTPLVRREWARLSPAR